MAATLLVVSHVVGFVFVMVVSIPAGEMGLPAPLAVSVLNIVLVLPAVLLVGMVLSVLLFIFPIPDLVLLAASEFVVAVVWTSSVLWAAHAVLPNKPVHLRPPSAAAGDRQDVRRTAPSMERQRFAQHLESATKQAIDFARRYLTNELAGEVNYLVEPNQSCDDNLREGEVVFPEDSLPAGAHHGPWAAERVVEFLWRDGSVPEWIDIAISEVPPTGGIRVGLLCCGRFAANDALLYYSDGPVAPFGIKSPVLPPDWQDGDKFDVNWRRDLIALTKKGRPWWRFC